MTLYRDRRKPAPRLLSAVQAAAYCGVSVATFEQWTPVQPLRPAPAPKRKLWDIKALDAWLDRESGLESTRSHDETDPYQTWKNGRRRAPQTRP